MHLIGKSFLKCNTLVQNAQSEGAALMVGAMIHTTIRLRPKRTGAAAWEDLIDAAPR